MECQSNYSLHPGSPIEDERKTVRPLSESAASHAETRVSQESVAMSIYRVIRIDIVYKPEETNTDAAKSEAVDMVVAEALSNALYNGETNGVSVVNIEDCGDSE